MGHLPSSGVFQKSSSFATLMPEHVRSVSGQTRTAIWNSTRSCVDKEIAEAAYAATIEEVNKGWLCGPYGLDDLPEGASLTRRFGIMQSSSTSDGRHTGMVVTSFFSMLGWDESDEKDAGFLTVARVLGVCIDLSDTKSGLVSVYNTDSRKTEIKDSIDKLLETGAYKRGELLTLRGRLLFAENQIFGKPCNVAMKIVSSYAEHHPHGTISSPEKQGC